MEEKINFMPYVIAGGAFVVGAIAAAAAYNKLAPSEEKKNLRPFKEFLEKSEALGRLTISNIMDWYKENPLYNNDSVDMLLAVPDAAIVNFLGFEYNSEVDPEHYIVQAFADKETNRFMDYRVISFAEISADLKKQLDSGNGMIVIYRDEKKDEEEKNND